MNKTEFLQTAARKGLQLPLMFQGGLSAIMSQLKMQIYITKTINELLFEGYVDKLIDMKNAVPLPDEDESPPFDRFGWFYMVKILFYY